MHPPTMLAHPLAFVLAFYLPLSIAVPARDTCHISKSISWTNCRIFGYNDTLETVKPQCGYFTVPTDYKNCAAGSVKLAVVRRPAVVKPRLGTLFFNPGNVHTCVATFQRHCEVDHQILRRARRLWNRNYSRRGRRLPQYSWYVYSLECQLNRLHL